MTPNQYYYWQRKVRKSVYLEQHADLPQAADNAQPFTFMDLPEENLKNPTTAFALSGFRVGDVTGIWHTKRAFRLQICNFQFTNKLLTLQTGTSIYNSA